MLRMLPLWVGEENYLENDLGKGRGIDVFNERFSFYGSVKTFVRNVLHFQ